VCVRIASVQRAPTIRNFSVTAIGDGLLAIVGGRHVDAHVVCVCVCARACVLQALLTAVVHCVFIVHE
jgi:hypothetical protein